VCVVAVCPSRTGFWTVRPCWTRERPIELYELDGVEDALAASHSGKVLKPVIRMPQASNL
jgi:hypothetical protein